MGDRYHIWLYSACRNMLIRQPEAFNSGQNANQVAERRGYIKTDYRVFKADGVAPGNPPAFLEHIADWPAGAAPSKSADSSAPATGSENTRLARARRLDIEQKMAIRARDLIPVGDVTATWERVLADVRAQVMAVPAHVRAVMPHLSPTDLDQLETELRRALMAAADELENSHE